MCVREREREESMNGYEECLKDSGPSVSLWHKPIFHASMVLNLTSTGSGVIGLLI